MKEASEQRSYQETLLLHYWHILRKRRHTVVLFLSVFMVTVFVASLKATSYYSSTAIIEISPKEPVVMDVDEVSDMVTEGSAAEMRIYYATQYRIIQSRTVMEETIRRLREVHGITDFDEEEEPVRYLLDLIKVSPEIDTHLVKIAVEHPVPETAALFANTIAEVYMDANLDRAMDASRQALEYLQKQQAEFRTKLIESDTEVHDFKFKYDLVGMNQQRNTELENLDRIRAELNLTHTERVKLQDAYNEVVRLYEADDWLGLAHTLAADDVVIRDMLGRVQQLRQDRSQMAARWKDRHPNVVRLDAELAGLEGQVRQQVSDLIDARRTELNLVMARERSLTGELDRVRSLTETLDARLIELKSLETEAIRNETFFKNLDTRMEEVDLSQVIRANNVRFVDPAIPGTDPVRPKILVNLGMALVLGLVGGCGLAFFAEYLDATVKSKEDVEYVIGAAFLGVVPRISPTHLKTLEHKRDQNIIVYARPRSTVAECLRTIRTNILFRLGNQEVRRLLITSAAPREGKSFISSNISAIMAMAGSKVLAIDADLRRPTLHKLFDMPNTVGLANVLAGQVTAEQAIQPSHVPDLHVLTAGTTPPNPAELLENGSLTRLLDALKQYDTIIIDSPPVNAVADPLVLSGLVDGVVFVVETNQTNRSMVRNARMRLSEMNARILGAVVNKLDVKRAGYGYYYYYYYDSYPYYYSESEADRGGSRRPRKGPEEPTTDV